jgi:hypothetical protein
MIIIIILREYKSINLPNINPPTAELQEREEYKRPISKKWVASPGQKISERGTIRTIKLPYAIL